jgi:hypothetical protein
MLVNKSLKNSGEIMNIKKILSFAAVFLLAEIPINKSFAQDFSIGAGGDFVSRYIWRGINVNDQPNIQPYISLDYAGLQLGFWGSYGLSHLNSTDEYYVFQSEIDTWLSYSLTLGSEVNLTALLTDYYFPNSGIKIGNFNNYDNVNGPGAHTVEAGLTIAGSESFPLSLSGYINIYNDEGNNTYFQADYSTSMQAFNLDVFAGAAGGSNKTPGYYGTDKFNFVHVGVKVSKSVVITESFSLPVYCSYILNPKSETSFLVLGISI